MFDAEQIGRCRLDFLCRSKAWLVYDCVARKDDGMVHLRGIGILEGERLWGGLGCALEVGNGEE